MNPMQLDALHSEVGHFLKAASDYLDAVDLFDIYELQFYISLLTNHDVEAKSLLDRFNDQFSGKKSQKIMVMRSMYYEATGDVKAAIDALGTDPNELRASRRLATFSRTRADGSYNAPEYIKSLNYYLDLQPSDIKAWAELGDVYSSVGHYDKAVFCFKEVLLHKPDAHNFFYKAGLNLYLQHLQNLDQKSDKKDALLENLRVFEHARDCFLGCVDINESATNGWLGIYLLAKSPLLEKLSSSKSVPSAKNIELLCTNMGKLGQLSQKQIMKIEGLADETAFAEFLQEK
ncbi:hypothetical protein JCM33374_g1704 [Metschnikowia sp. JCM 33374]|nr:hypothetical protein JCM33374_g1704 [Metschnikowia sp. JCM 33374]